MGRGRQGYWRGAYSPSMQRPWKESASTSDWAKQPVFPTYKAMPQEPPAEQSQARTHWVESSEREAFKAA